MKLLCAGEAFDDLIFVGLERLPEPGEEVKTDRFTATIGGGAVITAVKAARLGMRTQLISALGPAAVTRLKKERVAVTNLLKPGEPHAITAALSTGDDRAFVTFNGVNSKLEGRLAKRLASLSRRSSSEAYERRRTHIHLCFYPHNCQQWVAIVTKLRSRGVSVSWDFGWNEPLTNDRGLTDLIDSLDFVFINSREAALYTGTSSLQDAVPEWRKRRAVTIIKLGDQGAVWLAPDRDILVPAPKVTAIDTTGAGDSFNAGFLVAWMTGKTPEQCLAAGNKLGSASTKHAGGI